MPGEPWSTVQHDALVGVQQRQVADDVARRIVGDRRRRIVGRLVDDAAVDALTKPWFEITVPSITVGSTITSNVIVATLPGALGASAGIAPGVASAGALIDRPFTSGDSAASVGDRRTVQRRAAGDVGRVDRDLVAQHDIGRRPRCRCS